MYKKLTTFTILSLVAFSSLIYAIKGKPVKKYPFYVYKDRFHKLNHYIPSGYMGDWGDIRVKDGIRKNPKSGTSCMRINYSAKASQGASWAGIFWQNPANNWGTKKGGFDLSKAKKLTFWARGKKGGEIVEFKVGGITGKYSDTGSETTGPVTLSRSWKKFSIDMSDMLATYISGGFCVVFTKASNPNGCSFYLDEIRFEK